jgi:hypothetical protein
MPAPGANPTRPAVLRQAVQGVPYPNWSDRFGLPAVGQRRDQLGARRVVTVVYSNASSRIGYTIVPGAPLAVPHPVTTVVRNGVAVEVLRTGNRPLVTWLREGHSCVLSGQGTSAAQLVKLATWAGPEGTPYSQADEGLVPADALTQLA